MNPAEHRETLPAASLELAWKVVVVLSPTRTARPGDANLAAEPDAAGGPLQPAPLKSLTLGPGTARPLTRGLLSLAGEAGSVPVIRGLGAGACRP